jgi:glycolate oxidase
VTELRPLTGPGDPRLDELKGLPLVTDPEALESFAGDESVEAPVRPGAVLEAMSVGQISTAMAWASRHGVPVTPRGAGTGKAGGCIPSSGGLVLALGGMNRITGVMPEHGFAEVESGAITGPFRQAMEHEHRLFYPPDPASLDRCTLGGNVATNAGGPVALKYGVTGRFVMGLTAVLPDGRVIETGRRQPKDVAGYDLTSLLVGSEGTLAVLAGIRLGLLPVPREIVTVLLEFERLDQAARAVVDARMGGVLPRAMEFVGPTALKRARVARPGAFGISAACGALLLVEIDGPEGTTGPLLDGFLGGLTTAPLSARRAASDAERAALWDTRRQMSTLVKHGTAGWISEDIAVPLGAIPGVIARLDEIGDRHEVSIATYGHAGDGNLHVNVLWDTPDAAPRGHAAVDAVMAHAVGVGGTITGEHGVGTAKRRWLSGQLRAPVLDLQRAIKRQWDPAGILNPGKVL